MTMPSRLRTAAAGPPHDSRTTPSFAQADPSWIAGRLRVFLAHYFDAPQPDEVREAVAREWIAILLPFPREALEAAFREWLISEPRRRAGPGDIRGLAVKWLDRNAPPKPSSLPAVEHVRERVSPDAAARILKEAGWDGDAASLLKRFPMAMSIAEAEELAVRAAAQSRHWSETADPDGPEWQALRASRDANPIVAAARAAETRQGPQDES